ncbi:RtcB family protein [Novipirellula artificiosorum]|uniref:3'-phosphate/5'-hydroxy nucleic acid ligase n=1 Tax=Novipirellula artificiosorum TaxID=2528016 RepID=A0A5C6E546_9BACT|nr:RtcB family protein [Novipirellula artificiosorum]TWU42279.1 RNA-splicing ligase RtcB [Novipirellula artificiosorum]
MKARELNNLGVPKGPVMKIALEAVKNAAKDGNKQAEMRERISAVVATPDSFTADPIWGTLASKLAGVFEAQARYIGREDPAPWKQWGDGLEAGAVDQMVNACKLPVTVSGALMPDAHQGYGLPIGGVLATKDCVIPYAVGVDIACRMKMTVLDLPVETLNKDQDRLRNAIERETLFGVGAGFRKKREHDVLDADWTVSPITKLNRDKAWKQLGTSGSGNHFVEFGVLTLDHEDLGLEAGTYLALLSHSGSRGTGAAVCSHYSSLAKEAHPELPRELSNLAWLDLDSEAGMEYWAAMNLMGEYAAANHACIHHAIKKNLSVDVLLDIENHHNFAWKETHGGEELIVHRKGATPAGDGVLGIIPGSMGTPGYIVRGKGVEASLRSASHGAGRRMSRTAAKAKFNWKEVKRFLDQRGVTLMSAGLDEVPMAYKDIEEVMASQQDLVESVARFDPKLVKMAKAGERPED